MNRGSSCSPRPRSRPLREHLLHPLHRPLLPGAHLVRVDLVPRGDLLRSRIERVWEVTCSPFCPHPKVSGFGLRSTGTGLQTPWA